MADPQAVPFSVYEGILSVLAGPDGPIIACGQAVNFWADRFCTLRSRVSKLMRPFMRVRIWIFSAIWPPPKNLPKATESPIQRAPHRSATPVLANIHLKTGASIHLIQILRGIAGLNSDDVRKHAISVEVSRSTIRVVDPISLLVGKVYNVVHIDQKDRHDIQHVKILFLCVPVFLSKLVAEAEQNPRAARTCLNDLERVLALSASADAAKVSVKLGINWLELIPLKLLRSSSNPRLQAFADKRLHLWTGP